MRILALSFCVFALLGTASAQLTIDATVPIHERRRKPTGGSGGSIGYKLPVLIKVKTIGAPPDENGKTVIEFSIKNLGKTDLTIPTSPHPGDFEPADAAASYTVKMLSLFLTLDTRRGAERQQVLLPGGAYLYGTGSSPGTLVSLAPGDSIHVLARIKLPTEDQANGKTIVARTTLRNL